MDTENEFLETLVDHFLANIRRTYVRAPEPESLSSVRNQAKKLEEYLRSNSNHPTVAAMIENALSKFEFEEDQWNGKMRMADELRQKGNGCMQGKKFRDAVREYTYALEWNPMDSKAYSSRSLAFYMLGMDIEALDDAEKCVEIDPKFSRGYLRKGSVLLRNKEFAKALETFQEGLECDPTDQYLNRGVRKCLEHTVKNGNGVTSGNQAGEIVKGGSRVGQQNGSAIQEVDMPCVETVTPKPGTFVLKLSNVILTAEVVAVITDNLRLRLPSLISSFIAVCGHVEVLRHHQLAQNKSTLMKLLCASLMFMCILIEYLAHVLHKNVGNLENFGREAWPFHVAVVIASLLLND